MHDKKVKIIYFSVGESGSNEIELTWRKFSWILSSVFVLLLFLVGTSLALFTDFYQNLHISSLSKTNSQLQAQLVDIGGKIETITGRVDNLEEDDDHLRIIADLPKIDEDTRTVGVGGALDAATYVSSSELVEQIYDYQSTLAQMERRLELSEYSRIEVQKKLEENKNLMKHMPSIRPLTGGRISDRFGFRLHPVIDKIRRHPGVDIAAERGTEVFATAAGTVEKVVTKYQRNKSWGKYVLINHGFGHKTLYGHLSKVLVRQGQKIDRWNPVGLVGATGLATGPHLHYEVRKDGTPLDPQTYILN